MEEAPPTSRPHRYRSRRRRRRALPKRVDRWRWRRRLRSRPSVHLVYRGGVATVGVATIVLALAIGWLPGPGGIPLALIGLAILASEFVWAHRILGRARHGARDLARWTAAQSVMMRRGLALATACGVLFGFWVIMAIAGIPPWLPGWLIALLDAVPGLRPA